MGTAEIIRIIMSTIYILIRKLEAVIRSENDIGIWNAQMTTPWNRHDIQQR